MNVLDQGVPMGRLAAKRLKDHHLKGAREQITRGSVIHRLVHNRPRVAMGKKPVKQNCYRPTSVPLSLGHLTPKKDCILCR